MGSHCVLHDRMLTASPCLVRSSLRPPHALWRPGRQWVTLLQQRSGSRRARALSTGCIRADYAAKLGEIDVLKRPLKAELRPSDLINVFGFPRDFEAKYKMGECLGAGSFGIVREGFEVATGRRWAVKSVMKTPKTGRATPRYLLKLQTEVDAMRQLGASLDAVHLKDVFEDDVSVHMVMELCDGGSVLDGLKLGDYSEKQVQHIMRSVLRFLSQSHSKGIIYRDVKPDNFLAKEKNWAQAIRSDAFLARCRDSSSKGSRDEAASIESPIKATDFGLAMRHRPGDPPLRSRSGTPAYMAPEVIQQCYDFPADIWSAGTMLYQLLTGKFPFWDSVKDCTLQDVWKSILSEPVNFTRPELQQVSTSARGLLMSMLDRDPGRRITAAKALEHPWLKEDLGTNLPFLHASVVQRLQRFATHGQLKQLVLRTIAESIKVERDLPDLPGAQDWMHNVTLLFGELDTDSSGSVSLEELARGLDRLGFDVSPGEMEVLMARIDVNHDGILQLSEFVASLVDWGVLQRQRDWKKWVRAVFDSLDKDGNGFISLEELATELGDSMDDEERIMAARRMLREADINGDGQVSWKEFMELVEGNDDSLSQYDTRLRRYADGQVDEAFSSLDSFSSGEDQA